MQLLVATTNKGKQREIASLLILPNIEIVFPHNLESTAKLDIPETGSTFEENALLKARAYGQVSGLLSVADDSGLEVAALNGFPGVNSNRWYPGPAQERVQALLDKMQGITDRRAAFVTASCLYDPTDNTHQLFRGEITGTLSETIRGTEGFDYDYIFIPDGYEQTFAEMGVAAKNNFSHRAAAFMKVHEFLKDKK